MRRLAIAAIALALVSVGVAVGAVTTARFTDVPEDHWAVSYMEWADQAGIITANEDGEFRPSEKVSRAQLASYFYKYDRYHNEKGLSIAENDAIQDILWSPSFSDPERYVGTSAAFDRAYSYGELIELTMDLCEALGDTPANASLRDTQDVISNWLTSVDWKQGVTDVDRWRVVWYGHQAICSEYRSIYDVWENAGWPPLDFS